MQNCLPLWKSGECSAIPVRKGESAGSSNKVGEGGVKGSGSQLCACAGDDVNLLFMSQSQTRSELKRECKCLAVSQLAIRRSLCEICWGKRLLNWYRKCLQRLLKSLAASVAMFACKKMAVKQKVVHVKQEENFVLPRANVF